MTPLRRPEKKIISCTEAVARLGPPRDRVLVFTNGVFDVLHAGHTSCLVAARSLGDELIVALNSDASVRRLEKGPARPIQDQASRAAVLASLECVDYVCMFEEETPLALIEVLLPDVLVKGADYSAEGVVGREVVEGAGGRVELIPLLAGFSTSEILERIRLIDPGTGHRSPVDG